MNIPSDLKYTKDHEWIRAEGKLATVGITDYAQGELGDIVFVEVGKLGESLEKESSFGSVETVKTVSDLFMPVSGIIVELNPEIEKNPQVVNSDPYGLGWIIKIELNNPSDVNDLLTADEYSKQIGG